MDYVATNKHPPLREGVVISEIPREEGSPIGFHIKEIAVEIRPPLIHIWKSNSWIELIYEKEFTIKDLENIIEMAGIHYYTPKLVKDKKKVVDIFLMLKNEDEPLSQHIKLTI